jgi:hypothetical protein
MAFRSYSKATSATTTCTVTAPTGITDDDILVLGVYVYDVNTHTITLPAGFTAWYTYGPDGTYHYYTVGWKRASSESGDYTVSLDGETSQRMDCHMACFSGRKSSGDPATLVTNDAYATNDTTLRAVGLDAVVGDDLFIFGAGRSGGAISIGAFANSATNLGEYEDATTNSVSTCSYMEDVTTGATGDFDATTTLALYRKHGFVVALAEDVVADATITAASTLTNTGTYPSHLGGASALTFTASSATRLRNVAKWANADTIISARRVAVATADTIINAR